ncbi:TetR/AcrR family transcriptional regulator [Roseixanthobacter glucoisosaccharinicivorans]|uniref:TetR/AcrR family transcriptional regulator n=1 Tax=Roseixanthobacter glucoisosaccharinicivorans TaxID=3119923 RepID=UPI00372B74EB
MKVSKERAAEHRAAIIAAAARLFRERGFDGVGVAEITRAAGLTHGGFYGHFASKDALAVEAFDAAFARSVKRVTARAAPGGGGLPRYLESYLSLAHRDAPQEGCPMAAVATQVDQQDAKVQQGFTTGIEAYIAAFESLLPQNGAKNHTSRRARAMLMVSALVGGMALARAVARSDASLSQEILEGVHAQLLALAEAETSA